MDNVKDPKMRLVPYLTHIYVWQKEELERSGINGSKMIREYFDERLEKTKEIELAELQAEINDVENLLATKKAMMKSIKESSDLKKERDKEKFLEDYLDAFVLKKFLMDGRIPNKSPIFDFPDRDAYIKDINNGNISVSSELEEFGRYRFKVVTKADPQARARFKNMFTEFMQTGVMK